MVQKLRYYTDTEIGKVYSHDNFENNCVCVGAVGLINDDPGTRLLEVMRICDESWVNECENPKKMHYSRTPTGETFEDLDVNQDRTGPVDDKVLGMFKINSGEEIASRNKDMALTQSRENRTQNFLQTDGLHQ